MKKQFVVALIALAGTIFNVSGAAHASVSIVDTYKSDFYGSPGGSYITSVDCDPGSVMVGLNGQDVTEWSYAIGLQIICKPIEDLLVPGSGTTILPVIAIGGWTDFKTVQCADTQGGIGLNLITFSSGGYLKNLSLDCVTYPDAKHRTSTSYFGEYTSGPKQSVFCRPNDWLTGVSIRTGSGIDAISITCSTIKVTSSAPIITKRQSTNGSCSSASINATNKSSGKGSTQNANAFCSSSSGPSITK